MRAATVRRRIALAAGRSPAGMLLGMVLFTVSAVGQQVSGNSADQTAPASKFRSAEAGNLDVSGFLDEPYGFLPIAMPITEPAVGYGGAGALAFISNPDVRDRSDLARPNITAVGGMGTQNGSWGALAGDSRHWLDDRVQTLVGIVYASIHLDYYGVGDDPVLSEEPLGYNLQPKGGAAETKYRIGDSRAWIGLLYAYAATDLRFDAPVGTPGLPSFRSRSNVGGLTPSFTFDTRDNIFTPTRGTYLGASASLFSPALGGDDDFQRVQLQGMQYWPLKPKLFLGTRAQVSAGFGDTPFYLRPFIYMRGVPLMRYQGEEMAQIETELRWQFWRQFSLVGFVGGGLVWTGLERLERTRAVPAGGVGFRYEVSRKYGIHMGLDVAVGPADPAIYIQVGSAWARP